MAGAVDSVLLAHVQSEGRIFLTMDKGIADIRRDPPDQFAGLVLFRPTTTGPDKTLAFVRKHLPALLQLDLNGQLFVVSEAGIRIR